MDGRHYLLIIGYLEGNISEEETQYLLQKVQTDQAFSHAFEDIAEIWLHKGSITTDDLKSYRALAYINSKIDELQQNIPEPESAEISERTKVFRLPLPDLKLKHWISIAASILIISILAVFYRSGLKSPDNAVAYIENVTAPGQKKTVTLPDGTRIMLNADSKLRIDKNFGGVNRTVYLEGEAWFDVKRNPRKPFIVHTGKVATQVLGTHFNISAYKSDGRITVSLVQGKVQVDINNDPSKRVILEPGKQMVFSKATQQAQVANFMTDEVTGWKENKLIFNYDSWPEAAKKLSRWYGVRVELQDGALLQCKLKATFDNAPLAKVMQQIGFVSAIKWKIQGEKLIISGKCN